jgi:hypothetical protein
MRHFLAFLIIAFAQSLATAARARAGTACDCDTEFKRPDVIASQRLIQSTTFAARRPGLEAGPIIPGVAVETQ